MKLLNAFSLSMVPVPAVIHVIPTSLADVRMRDEVEPFESAIGHADTAGLLSGLLGRTVAMNRVSVKLSRGDMAVVAQYVGPRLPEGTTALPEGSHFEFRLIVVK